MKAKTKFILLTTLMAFSLIGLVFIQSYWIHSVIVERTVEFEENVNRSLREISRKLSADEVDEILSRYPMIKDISIQPKVKQMDFTYMSSRPELGESISLQMRTQVEEITLPLNKMGSPYNDSIQIRNYFDYSSRVHTKPLYEGSTAGPKYSISYGGNDEEDMLLDNFLSKISIIGDKTPIQKRINPEKLVSTINDILAENNINIRYQWGILSDGELSSLHSDKYDTRLSPYHTGIFPQSDKDQGTKYELVLRFPHEMGFVVKSIIPMIIMSIAFIIIILLVFTSAIYHMIKQKKVADMKNDFINNMTHEFKTPIATINIAADALHSERINNDCKKVEHYAEIIKQENRRMLLQVESVLRIARLERGQMDFNKEPSDLNSLLEEALEHIELIVSDRNGSISETFDASACEATVDRMHMINIFLNILDNANKYSPDKPEISVRTYNTENFWAVDITDKGIGMSKNDIKKIFETFYRIPTGDIHNIKGHGLGLAYSKKIVEKHGGVIEVKSAPEKGSTFTIKIPLD